MNVIVEAMRDTVFFHRDQKRKYTGKPYHEHPIRVFEQLCILANNVDDDMCVAALGHDWIEDCPQINPLFLADKYGNAPINIIDELTNVYTKENYPKLNRAQRKSKEFERLSTVSNSAKVIKLLDRIDNLNDIPFDVDPKYAKTLFNESKELFKVLENCNEELVKLKYEATLKNFERYVR